MLVFLNPELEYLVVFSEPLCLDQKIIILDDLMGCKGPVITIFPLSVRVISIVHVNQKEA